MKELRRCGWDVLNPAVKRVLELTNTNGGAIPEVRLSELLEINKKSVYYNLVLSKEDVFRLVSERNSSLAYAERVEFGFDTLEYMIDVFYKSPYINQFEYVEILSELQFIFYALKNEVGETFTDEELINLLSELFDGSCQGSLELLKGHGVEYVLELAGKRNAKIKKKDERLVSAPYYSFAVSGGNELLASYSDEELFALKLNLTAFLEELAPGYVKGRSFSIKAEDAQKIVQSVLYAAEISGERGIYDLNKLKSAYSKGIEIIEGLLEDSKSLYKQVLNTRIDTGLKTYNASIESIAGFFKKYDRRYNAADIPAEITYFPALCDGRLKGASFVKQYLSCLLYENIVCQMFSGEQLESLISGYIEKAKSNIDWSFPNMNIFKLAVTNSLLAAINGKPPSDIVLLEEDGRTAGKGFDCDNLDESVDYFLSFFEISDTALVEYVKEFVSKALRPEIEK